MDLSSSDLLICGLRSSDLARTLCALDPADGRLRPWPAGQKLETALARTETRLILVLYEDPVTGIAAALQGADPNAALQAWAQEITTLLTLHRKNRRRLVLVNIDGLRQNARKAAGILGLDAQALEKALADGKAPDATTDPVNRMLAAFGLRADPGHAALADELEASSLALGPGPRALPFGHAVAAWRDQQDSIARLQARLDEIQNLRADAKREMAEQRDRLTAEREILVLQNQAMLSDLRRAEESRISLQARLDQVNQGLESAEVQIRQAEADLATGQEILLVRTGERDRLQAERETMTHRIETLERDLAERGRALEAQAGENRWLHGEIARILGSNSMRLTAPLRALRAFFGQGRA